ncbi:MAG: hypothetical protein WKG07_21815 [Hymenobacter sp.]
MYKEPAPRVGHTENPLGIHDVALQRRGRNPGARRRQPTKC